MKLTNLTTNQISKALRILDTDHPGCIIHEIYTYKNLIGFILEDDKIVEIDTSGYPSEWELFEKLTKSFSDNNVSMLSVKVEDQEWCKVYHINITIDNVSSSHKFTYDHDVMAQEFFDYKTMVEDIISDRKKVDK